MSESQNALSVCLGRAALGRCQHEAKYFVGATPACGVHVGQIVKLHVRTTGSAIVRAARIKRSEDA